MFSVFATGPFYTGRKFDNTVPIYSMNYRLTWAATALLLSLCSLRAQLSVSGCTGNASLGGTCSYTVSGANGASILWSVTNGQFEIPNQPGFTPISYLTTDTTLTVRFTKGPAWDAGQAVITATANGQSASLQTNYACYGPLQLTVLADTVRGVEGQPVRMSAQLDGTWLAQFPTGNISYLPHSWEGRAPGDTLWQTVSSRGQNDATTVLSGWFNGHQYLDSADNSSNFSHLWLLAPSIAFHGWEFQKTTQRCKNTLLVSSSTTILQLSGLGTESLEPWPVHAWFAGNELHLQGTGPSARWQLHASDGRSWALGKPNVAAESNPEEVIWLLPSLPPGLYFLTDESGRNAVKIVR